LQHKLIGLLPDGITPKPFRGRLDNLICRKPSPPDLHGRQAN
jgi:hypothetical protein